MVAAIINFINCALHEAIGAELDCGRDLHPPSRCHRETGRDSE